MNLEHAYHHKVERVLRSKVVARQANPDFIGQARDFAYQIALVCFVGDVCVVVACLMIAFWLRFDTNLRMLGVPEVHITLPDYLSYIFCGSISLLLVLGHKGMYQTRRLLHQESQIKELLAACLLWSAVFLGVSLLFKFQPPLSRVYVALATLSAIGGLYTWRRLLYGYLRKETVAGRLRERILVVGWSRHADRLQEIIGRNLSHPCRIVACVPGPDDRFQTPPPMHLEQAGSFKDIPSLLQILAPDIVLVADANLTVTDFEELASLCEKEMIQFKVVPSYFSILISGLHLETLSGIPMLELSGLPLDKLFNRMMKRIVDIVGSICGLLISAPVISVFGALVYLESPGPVFYRQQRLGRNGKIFNMWKIRSMRLDAEKGGQVGWSRKDDPRRLRIGAFMRKWNIDEIPQFWNVLKGDMSLVGPRPERPEFIQEFKHQIPHYNARHTVKPGITGWAQVNGLRGDTDLLERVTYDLHYVEHWNLFFDLQTMFLTLLRYDNAH